jgi:hypothetical protein
MLVYYGKATPANTGGVVIMPAAVGICDNTNHLVPFGVIIGDNNATPTYSTLATALVKVQTITGVETLALQNARDFRGVEGMYSKGDPQPMVQVARITPETVLKGYFRNSATVGTTMITTLSPTAVASTAMTFATFGLTPVADNATTYCVSGKNAGSYRVATNTSATAYTYTREWPVIPATTDTFKTVNVRQGYCRLQLDTTYGLWIDNVAAMTSHYYAACVLSLDLGAESGNESCTFSFAYDIFLLNNNGRTTT